jgi:hypothetical protein
MAYFNQERKAQLAPLVKTILKKYKLKGSLSVRNHSTFVLNIKSGKIDFIENYIATDANKPYGNKMSDDRIAYVRKEQSLDINPYWFQEHFTGVALKCLTEVFAVMNNGNHDNSDIQSDYFDVGWYVDVNVGKWNSPYIVE